MVDRYETEQLHEAQVVPARPVAQPLLGHRVPGDRQTATWNAEEEPLPLLERLRNTPGTGSFADNLGESAQQPGLEQSAVSFGGVQALPDLVDGVVDDEERLLGRACDADQPGGAREQEETLDVGIRPLLGTLEPQLEGTGQAGVDLGQGAQRQLMRAGGRRFVLGKERQQRVKVAEDGAGAGLVDGRVAQQALVSRGEFDVLG